MPRLIERLTQHQVNAISKPGLHADGGGLYLQVTPSGTKSWALLYSMLGKSYQAGLGSTDLFNLREARERARAGQQQIRDGVNPIASRRAQLATAKLEAAQQIRWRPAVEKYIETNSKPWSENYRHGFRAAFERHTYLILGRLDVDAITQEAALRCFKELWDSRPPTAAKLLRDCRKVWDWLRKCGYKVGPTDPFDIKHRLGDTGHRTKHREAMHYRLVPTYLQKLRMLDDIEARAAEMLILCACRPIEAIRAKIADIDLEGRVWAIDAEDYKTGRKTGQGIRIPLSARALEIVRQRVEAGGEWLFPKAGRALADDALLRLLRSIGEASATAHGFRSSFADWCGDAGVPGELRELSLGHTIGDATQQAYLRSDLLERRRPIMEAWSTHCSGRLKADNVVVLDAEARKDATSLDETQVRPDTAETA